MVKDVLGGRLGFRVLCVGRLCRSASIPPTVQFFREVGILVDCSWAGVIFLCLVGLYLFFGGLVPLFLLGYLLGRHVCVEVYGRSGGLLLMPCVFLCGWCYLLFLIM